jgi:hypothetical protein
MWAQVPAYRRPDSGASIGTGAKTVTNRLVSIAAEVMPAVHSSLDSCGVLLTLSAILEIRNLELNPTKYLVFPPHL